MAPGWRAARDQTSGKFYYFNAQGLVRWDQPVASPAPGHDASPADASSGHTLEQGRQQSQQHGLNSSGSPPPPRLRSRSVSTSSSSGPIRNLHDLYYIGQPISPHSKGGNAEVLLCMRKADGLKFALKVVRLGAHTRESRSQVRALQCVNHVGIIKLVDWFETIEHPSGDLVLYMVMELATGGDFLEHLVRCADRRLSETRAAACFKQVLEAVGHMHSRGLVHCDLKPENILRLDESENSPVKITDFGFAQFLSNSPNANIKQPLGLTPGYVAPEILRGDSYDCKADMWSLGVILYVLLSGLKPFPRDQPAPYIQRGHWNFTSPHFDSVSPSAKDLITRLLQVDSFNRLSWEEALAHDWIRGTAPEEPYAAGNYEQLLCFNKERGAYRYSAHALAGLMSRLALPSAVAAMSSENQASLQQQRSEGSIQPLITLAYSDNVSERRNACNAIANLALRPEMQGKFVDEGGLRLLNKLAAETKAKDVRFFVALSIAHLAKNKELRLRMIQADEAPLVSTTSSNGNASRGAACSSDAGGGTTGTQEAYNTIDSLYFLAGLTPEGVHQGGGSERGAGRWVNESPDSVPVEIGKDRKRLACERRSDRVQEQAVQALGLLAQEDELQEELMAGGVLLPLARQAGKSYWAETALAALVAVCASSLSLTGSKLQMLEAEISRLLRLTVASEGALHEGEVESKGLAKGFEEADGVGDGHGEARERGSATGQCHGQGKNGIATLKKGLVALWGQLQVLELDKSWEAASPAFAPVLEAMRRLHDDSDGGNAHWESQTEPDG